MRRWMSRPVFFHFNDKGGRVTGLPRDPDSSALTEERMPSWVKVFGIIGIVLVLLILVALLTGHGPGRHMPFNHHVGAHTSTATGTP